MVVAPLAGLVGCRPLAETHTEARASVGCRRTGRLTAYELFSRQRGPSDGIAQEIQGGRNHPAGLPDGARENPRRALGGPFPRSSKLQTPNSARPRV